MRIVKLYDSGFKLAGVGVQWGRPLTVIVRDLAGRTLGAMLNFGHGGGVRVVSSYSGETRVLMPVCESCKENPAQLWCRSHGMYTCEVCAAASAPFHNECEFYSLAAKRAMMAVTRG